MKIVKIESWARNEVGIVKVTTDSGHSGFGQIATYECADIVAAVLQRQVAPWVIGRGVHEQSAIVETVFDKTLKFPGSYVSRSVAAVDTALWDLRGKAEKKPVWELIGGDGSDVPVYGSSMSRKITPEDEAERMTRLRDEHGFRAFKIRVGKQSGHNEDEWPGRTEAIIPTVRAALGDDVTIHADANSCFEPPRAIEVGRMLEDLNYGHYEEPCPYWELDWTAAVRDKLRIPVSGGEQDNSMSVWKTMIRNHVVDIVQPDICYCGGLSRALHIASMAAPEGILCTPHSANHSMVTVFTLHLWNAMRNHGPFLEYSIEPQDAFQDLFSPRLKVVDGAVKIPDEDYGWGVKINEEWLAKSQYLCSDIDDYPSV